MRTRGLPLSQNMVGVLLVLLTGGSVHGQWQDPVIQAIRATPDVEHGQRAIPVDIDGDGDQDVITSYSLTDELVLELNGGDGTSWTPIQVAPENTWVGMFAVAADIDLDGDLDIVGVALFDRNGCGFCGPGEVAWFEQAGDPGSGTSDPTSWTKHSIDSALKAARYIDVGDIDGDDDLDLVVVATDDFGGDGELPNAVVWYENRLDVGSPDWNRWVIASALNNPESVRLAQFDGGDDLEVLLTEYWGERVSWYTSGGTPSADGWTGRTIATPSGPSSARPWDMNGDLRLDAVTAVHDGGEVVWFEQPADLQNGSWTSHLIAAVPFATDLAQGDLDNDGDEDIVVSTTDWSNSGSPGTVSYLENTGSGWTVHAQTYVGTSSVEVADLDGDGDLDVVSTSYDEHRTDWWKNVHPVTSIFADDFEAGNTTTWSSSTP